MAAPSAQAMEERLAQIECEANQLREMLAKMRATSQEHEPAAEDARDKCPYKAVAAGSGDSRSKVEEKPVARTTRSFSSGRNGIVRPRRGRDPVYYHSYLMLDELLSAQKPLSLELGGQLAHDEMLFIIIHQTYELWFKQILHDLDSCRDIFMSQEIDERDMHTVVERLRRITEIQRVLVEQLSILETMTPMSFLDFRDYLFPASGFQSLQFRLLEIKLGLRRDKRLKYTKKQYCSYLAGSHREQVSQREKEPSMLELVDRWLSRTPFLKTKTFDFWAQYQQSVNDMMQSDRNDIAADENLSSEEKAARLAEVQATQDHFGEFFDEEKFNASYVAEKRTLSYTATQAAIMIQLYQEEPVFQLPHQFLTLLLDIDELMCRWRHRHALMVHRMLGLKMGTGGSSGYHYLKATSSRHKIFTELFNLSMFLIPRSELPELPHEVRRMVSYHFQKTDLGAPLEKHSKE